MHALTAEHAASVLANASAADLRVFTVPTAFYLYDWDHHDFAGFTDASDHHRGYLFADIDGQTRGIVMRAASTTSRARSGLCDLCHAMQPGAQVTMFTARRAGDAGERGDSVGVYACADLTCHDNVRLALPLAPGEFRADVGVRIDETARRVHAFMRRVLA